MGGKLLQIDPLNANFGFCLHTSTIALIVVDINPIKINDKAAVADLHYFCQVAKLQKLRFRKFVTAADARKWKCFADKPKM